MSNPARYIWLNGSAVPWPEAKIHVNTVAVLTGENIFEGLRAYHDPGVGQVYVFRLPEHLDRLWQGMKIMRMTPPYTREALTSACVSLIRDNTFREDLQLRLAVYFGDGGLYAFAPDKIATGAFVIAQPRRCTLDDERGISVCVSAWRRIGDNVMPPRVKCGANYHQSRLVTVQANVDGYDGAVILNGQDKVAEGPGACLMMVRGGQAIMPPLTSGVLESITRATLVELLETEMGVRVLEREIDRTELYVADELFFCGSAWEITPITSVDRYPVRNGGIGAITHRLRQLYQAAIRGQLPKYAHWVTPVY